MARCFVSFIEWHLVFLTFFLFRFSCTFRFFLLFLDHDSFVFNCVVKTRNCIRQINVVRDALLGRMHVNRCCSDWTVIESYIKLVKAPCIKTDFCKHHLPVSQHFWDVRQVRTLRSYKMISKERSVKRNTPLTLCKALDAIKWRK